jgi:uncharacterized protein (TIGR03382 family)
MTRSLWLATALCCGSSGVLAASVRSSHPIRSPEQSAGTNASGPNCALGTVCRLQYYGGKVIPNVKVYQVNWTAGGQLDMSGFFGAVTNSGYLDWLDEYDTNIAVQAGSALGAQGTNQLVGRGVFAGSFSITPSPANAGGTQPCGTATTNCCLSDAPAGATCIQDAQIADELQKQIAAGRLPPSDENSLYFIYFPAGLVPALQGHSACVAGGFCGYHSNYRVTAASPSVYYAVMPSHDNGTGCDLGCGDPGLGTAFERISETSSHELAEAITDPEVGLATSFGLPLGWYDPNNAEIADICTGNPHDTVSAFVVQTLFSNRESASLPASACVSQRFDPIDFTLSMANNHASIAAGSSVPVSISTTMTSGGAQTINLSAANLPAGVTAAFDHASVSAGSTATLTLTAAAGASAARDAVVQLRGSNGPVTHTAGLLVQVTAPPAANDFSIGLTPTARSVVAGSSVAYALATGVISGSAETVHLTVAGLPSGVTASFASSNAATADLTAGTPDTLTLTAAAAAPATPATPLTIQGTTPSVPGGHTASVSLAVTAPADFSLALPVTGIAVPRGSSSALAVGTAVLSGSPAQVDLSAVNLPAGVTASFLPARVAPGSSSTMTLAASASAHLTAGVTFTVRASSPDAVHTRDATLSVTGTPGIPTIAITSPAAGPVSGTVEIDVNASPAVGASLSRVEVFVDGSSVGSSTSSPAKLFWPSAQVLDGSHALTATATDDDGGAATTAPVSLGVLNSASSSAGAGPRGGGCAAGGTPSALALLGLLLWRRSRRKGRAG